MFFICIYIIQGTYANNIVQSFQKYTYRKIFFDGANESKMYKYSSNVQEEGRDQQKVEVIASQKENAWIIYIKTKLQKLLILRRQESFNSWLLSNKSKKPLKISSSQNAVRNVNVEDLISADFKSDYGIESVISDDEVMLKSLNRKGAFSYVSLRPLGKKKFVARYYSRNKKPIKQITYTLGTVDGYTFWAQFTVSDLVYKDVKDVTLKTIKVETVKVPKVLFYPNTMQRSFTFFK